MGPRTISSGLCDTRPRILETSRFRYIRRCTVAALCLRSLEYPADCSFTTFSLCSIAFSITFSKVSSLYCTSRTERTRNNPSIFQRAVVNPAQDRVADGGVIWTSRVQNDHVYMRALETVTCLPSSSIEQVIGCGGAGHEANGVLGKGGCLSQIRNRSSRIRRAETARPRPSMKKCSCTSTREPCTRVTRPCVRSVRDPAE